LVALLGYMAIAQGVKVSNPNEVVPALFDRIFPEWFAGFSFSAIAIGALVPAAIMSIGAANLFTRNVWKPLIQPQISSEQEATVAKIVSLAVKLGALIFIIFLPTEYAIDLQLLGGIWMLQIFPSVVLGLYRAQFRGNALFLGWVAGMAVGIWLFMLAGLKPVFAIHVFGNVFPVYIGILALIVNLAVGFLGSLGAILLPNRGSQSGSP
jgi:SSS family solute:Na+ symporter